MSVTPEAETNLKGRFPAFLSRLRHNRRVNVRLGARVLSRALQNLAKSLGPGPQLPVHALEPQATKEWTVLIYQDGRDGLAYSAKNSLQEMAREGSGDRVNVVVQQTLSPLLRERLLPGMEQVPTRRYRVGQGQGAELLEERPPAQGLGDFLAWGMKNFPAQRYAVVIKQHGQGYLEAGKIEAELQQAGKSVDLISFDSCLMQQAEVAYQLKDEASVMVASQANVLAEAYPYAELVSLLKKDPRLDAPGLGRELVQAQAHKFHPTVQTAVDLGAQKELGAKVKQAVQALLEEKIPSEQIYTAMMSVRPIEAGDPSKSAFDFRDLPAFLENLASDPRLTSDRVRTALQEALQAHQQSVLAHHSGDNHGHWGNAHGGTVYMPWQSPTADKLHQYEQLDWSRDTGWDQLIASVFASPPVVALEPPVSGGSAGLSGIALRAYKKYVSGYLGVTCSYTPSCSQFTRQAILKHGLLEGSKYGAMRWISCDGSHTGHHPLPGSQEQETTAGPVALLAPPAQRASGLRRGLTHAAAEGARLVGQLAGAVGGAVLGAPLGLVLGGMIGHKVGNGSIDGWNQELFEHYQPSAPEKIIELEFKVASSAFEVRNYLLDKTGSQRWSGLLAGAYGALSGAGLGALGAAWTLGRLGARFAGLASSNGTRDLLGQFPRDPHTQDLLNRW